MLGLFVLALTSSLALAQSTETPLSFEETLTLALESPSVALAESQLELARQQLEVATGPVSAELGASYTQSFGSRTDETGEVSTSGGSLDAVSLQATFNVVPFGPSADTVQRAGWALEAAQNDLEDARADALVGAATLYLAALQNAQEVALLQAASEAAAATLEAVQARFDAGAANDAEVLDAEIALSQAENEQAQLGQDLAQSLAQLSQALGTQVTAVSGGVPEATLPEITDAEALLAARSDVVSAQLAVLEAELDRRGAVRDVLPVGSLDLGLSSSSGGRQVQVGAGYSTASFQPSVSASYDPSALNAGDGTSFSIRLGVSVPLDASSPATLRAADLVVTQGEQRLEQTLALARLELQGAENDVAAAQATVQLAERLVEQSQRALDDTKERFDLGLVSVLVVQQAELALAQAQLQATEARSGLTLAVMTYARTLSLDPTEVF